MNDYDKAFAAYVKHLEEKFKLNAEKVYTYHPQRVFVCITGSGSVEVYDSDWYQDIDEGSATLLESYSDFGDFLQNIMFYLYQTKEDR